MNRRQEKDRLDVIIGKNIRLEREARKLSRDELSEMMELTSSHMGLIERGERGATAVTLSKLSIAFNIPVDSFFANPNPGGLSVKEISSSSSIEHDNSETYAGTNSEILRRKIYSLVTCLEEAELEFVVHSIKGLMSMNTRSRGAEAES